MTGEAPNFEATLYYAKVLRELGFRTQLKVVSGFSYFSVIGRNSTPSLDTGWANWFGDYPNPGDFFEPLLAGSSVLPINNGNFSQTDIPALNRKISKLATEQLVSAQEKQYAVLDRRYMEYAPLVPYGNVTLSTIASKSIDLSKVIWNPTFGDDITSFKPR
jgi:peptide/nickel transport system substrate-binding protein